MHDKTKRKARARASSAAAVCANKAKEKQRTHSLSVAELVSQLQKFPPAHRVFVMPMPDDGDAEYSIQDVSEYDGSVQLVIDFGDANPC